MAWRGSCFSCLSGSSLRSVWLPQFFILLVVATALLLFVLLCRRNAYRIIALLAVMLIEIVLGIPQGSDLALQAILGTVFMFLTMTEVDGLRGVHPLRRIRAGRFVRSLASHGVGNPS